MTEEKFIIDTMKWSYSRLSSFYTCPFAWYRKYIECEDGIGNAFSSYGTLMHEILENYAKGNLNIFELSQFWIDNFNHAIPEDFPNNKYVDLREKYYIQGLEYLDNFDFDMEQYEILGVEKEVNFEIGGKPFVGYIDLLLKDKQTGEIIVFDHKSASLKFKKNGDISAKDFDHLEDFKRQLYLYSLPVIKEYGKVDFLEWNLFRDQKYYKIPFNQQEYENSIKWAEDTIKLIEQEESWLPYADFYYCHNICDQRIACEYKE